MKKVVSLIILAVLLLFLVSCAETGYLLQSAAGHWNIMRRAQPIDELLKRQDLSPELQQQLGRVVALRAFAVDRLGLPDNGSYRHYADLERPYAVWNVVAAPEFSLDLRQWCFPFAGCVTYRGYFSESAARAMAVKLTDEGYETDVYGVQAYSTLNWFNDPILNTFIAGSDVRLASLLFHELAHQVLYVPGDTVFNESFAKTVESEGVRLWLQEMQDGDAWNRYLAFEARHGELLVLLTDVSHELRHLYESSRDDVALRTAKESLLKEISVRYEALKRNWDGDSTFDAWMERGWNNARLGSLLTYHDLVPVFRAMLNEQKGDFKAFYSSVKELASLSATERLARLETYRVRLRAAAPVE